MDFLIWAPGFQHNSGGVIALHKLAHNLCLLGENAYLDSPSKNQNWLGELAAEKVFNMEETVVVYPEIIIGNPLHGKYVVRWLLNTAGVVGGDGIYGADDLIYKFANYFDAPDESKCLGELRAFDLQLNFWNNFNRPRSGQCHIIRKGHYKQLDKHSPQSLQLDGYDNYNMREAFNNKELLICYDSECWTVVQAALCGCDVVVIPKDGVTADEWKQKFKYFSVGVAYGFDDIEWARSTKHLVRENLENLEKESIELTKNFIRICKERIK